MKRVCSVLLALAVCISLCACGKANDDVLADTKANTQQTTAKEETQPKENTISLGEEITLEFAKITFDSTQIGYSVGGSGISTTAQDGMLLFSLNGSIQNTGGSNLSVANICAEMIFNGEYTYKANATINDSRSYPVSVAPLANAEYVLYAEIPEALLEMLETCQVHFSLNDGFASVPESAKSSDHAFVMELDEDACAAALKSTEEAHIFFQECPILPTPENYAPVYQASSSSSSRNGKVTSIRYSFAVQMQRNDDPKEIYATYLAKVQALGVSVANDSGSNCDIYAGGTKLASLAVEGSKLQFELVPGNENVAAPALDGSNTEMIPMEETALSIGDTIETDYVYMTLDTCGSTDEIRSGTSQYGSYRYYTSENGDPYFYLFGSFKNLGGTPVDIQHIYVQFCFDDKYNYKGEVDGVISTNGDFIDDVSPLAEVNYYLYAAVPQELIDTYSSCTVKIGFTKNFDYKVVDVNDLPQFNHCDDVFTVNLSR